MSVTRQTRLRPFPHVHARELDGETVLVDVHGGTYFGLDAIGSEVWAGFLAGLTLAEVVERMAGRYDVDPARLEADVVRLTTELVDNRLAEAT